LITRDTEEAQMNQLSKI